MGTKRIGLARTQALLEGLKRELSMGGTKLTGTKNIIKNVTAATTLTAADSGKTIVWAKASAHTLTLPACEAGLHFKIIIKTASNNPHKVAAASGDCFFGQVTVVDNADDKLATQVVTHAAATGTVADHDHLLLDGNANDTGSGAGSIIWLDCIDGDAWAVNARLYTTGTPSSIATIYGG